MPDVLIRGLHEQTIKRLKERAKRHGRSLQSEAKMVLENAAGFAPRMLAYNVGQLLCSTPVHTAHLLFQTLARCLGPRFVRAASKLYNTLKGTARSQHPPSTSGLL